MLKFSKYVGKIAEVHKDMKKFTETIPATEAAKKLGLTPSAFNQKIYVGKIKVEKFGGRNYVTIDELLRLDREGWRGRRPRASTIVWMDGTFKPGVSTERKEKYLTKKKEYKTFVAKRKEERIYDKTSLINTKLSARLLNLVLAADENRLICDDIVSPVLALLEARVQPSTPSKT